MGRVLGLKSNYYHIRVLCPWENHLASLTLGFLIYQVEIIPCWIIVKIKLDDTFKICGL